MKIGSDFERTLARLAQLAGVAALVAVQPSRDAKMLALAQALGALSGSTHEAQLADAEARATVTPRTRPAPGPSRTAKKKPAKKKPAKK